MSLLLYSLSSRSFSHKEISLTRAGEEMYFEPYVFSILQTIRPWVNMVLRSHYFWWAVDQGQKATTTDQSVHKLKTQNRWLLMDMVKTTEVTLLRYIWKIEVMEEDSNWLLETTGVKLMDDEEKEALISNLLGWPKSSFSFFP